MVRLGRPPVPVIVAGLAAAAGAFVILLADEVREGDTHALDQAILLAFREPGRPEVPLGGPWLVEVVRDVTALGGWGVLALLTLFVVGLLLLWRRVADAVLVTVSVLGSLGLNAVLKGFFERPRPDLVPHVQEVHSPSFPSGHAMMAASVYLTLAVILSRALPNLALRAYVFASALTVVGLVGVSRVYLGVHWPSDVLAGWAAGAAWALVSWAVAERWATRPTRDAA